MLVKLSVEVDAVSLELDCVTVELEGVSVELENVCVLLGVVAVWLADLVPEVLASRVVDRRVAFSVVVACPGALVVASSTAVVVTFTEGFVVTTAPKIALVVLVCKNPRRTTNSSASHPSAIFSFIPFPNYFNIPFPNSLETPSPTHSHLPPSHPPQL